MTRALPLAVAVLALSPALAQAETRYAAPNGTAVTECAQVAPIDTTLPGLISAKFTQTPVAGKPADLVGDARRDAKAWMGGPGHKANILQRRFRAIGVQVQAKDPRGQMKGAAVYTVNFGTKK